MGSDRKECRRAVATTRCRGGGRSACLLIVTVNSKKFLDFAITESMRARSTRAVPGSPMATAHGTAAARLIPRLSFV